MRVFWQGLCRRLQRLQRLWDLSVEYDQNRHNDAAVLWSEFDSVHRRLDKHTMCSRVHCNHTFPHQDDTRGSHGTSGQMLP